MELLQYLGERFWREDIWLPPNTTWADRVATPQNGLPNFMDLCTYPFLMAVVLVCFRYCILNPFVFSPVANNLGFKKARPRKIIPNELLEAVFKKHQRKVPEDIIMKATDTLQWTERKVERWLRARAAMNVVNLHTKIVECAWQLCYYTFAVFFGIYVLWDKPWVYDVNICWLGYPYMKVDADVWWYYVITLGFYWAMTLTHFLETRRKDFYQMFVHHIISICLIIFSFTCNFVRIGSLIILIHDIADIPLHMSKMLIYLKWKKLCDAVFALFSIVWIVTRCGIFPLYIVANTLFYATSIVPMHPVYYIFNMLLCMLVLLHFFWTYFILRMIVSNAVTGKIEDDRSSSDESLLSSEVSFDDVYKTN